METINVENKSCALAKTKEKKPFFVVKFVQKVWPAPIHASVRYDATINKWAIIDPITHEPKQHFESGVMKNVTFSTIETKIPAIGCGSARTGFIGVAEGDLHLHRSVPTMIDARNLSFSDGRFVDQDHSPISNASRVALMPDRRAIYWK